MRALQWILLLVLGGHSFLATAANRTHVRLLLPLDVAAPGQTVMAGLEMRMDKGWHTYWINPGEAGKATEIAWTLPEGITAGAIQWPVPEKYDWSGLINYVYHDETILFIPLTIAPGTKPGPVTLEGKVDWLECEEQCIPGQAPVQATFAIGSEEKPSAHRDRLLAAQALLPGDGRSIEARAWWENAGADGRRPVLLSWKKSEGTANVDFYPHEAASFLIQPATVALPDASGRAVIRKVVEKFDGEWPANVSGLIVERDANGALVGSHTVTVRVARTAAEAASGGVVMRSIPPAPDRQTVPVPEQVPAAAAAEGDGLELTLLKALGWAFLGGLILNIMPCVLPVISLKILGFVNQSREDPGRVRVLGMVYGLGVVASFIVLAMLVIGVTLAGGTAGWGMQFGNRFFLVGITVLVMLVAMNLFGLFEVHLGARTLGAAGALAGKEGLSGAFFNGVLATVLATPCTAPFLAPALGFAVGQPPAMVLILFVTVALGMAAPYLLLSWNPAWLRHLPKPGPWMVRFKVMMGFPMLATGIWLFSILQRHYGGEGVLWIGLFIVILALAAWMFGEFVQRGGRAKGWAGAVVAALLAGGYLVTLEGQLDWRHASAEALGAGTRSATILRGGITWEPWSPEAVERARSAGRPILVDFTADWCLTCKVNEKSSIHIEPVRRKLEEINAVALLGDHTLMPENIKLELRRYQRAGVPLVLVYPRDGTSPPLVLPTLLTPSIVLEALDKAAQVREASK